jgi:Zn-dependent protease
LPIFAVFEYLALFAIVLLHEFGHALACRQTGGYADRIILWPLGGIAFVNPPRRAGAMLWSIAAGPLVNVALLPIFWLLYFVALQTNLAETSPDTFLLLRAVQLVNIVILVFNLLPIYPLDGGQILRSLLWFPFGEIRSLQISCVIGLIGSAGLACFALVSQSWWLGIMAFFLLTRAVAGWRYAKALITERDAGQTVPPLPNT